MWFRRSNQQHPDNSVQSDSEAFLASLWKTGVIAEFEPDGTIIDANDAFLAMLGYDREDIAGKHHKMFCRPEDTSNASYRDFWRSLAAGTVQSGEFHRVSKDNTSLWLQATYLPVERNGSVCKIVKLAQNVTDMTKQRMQQEAVLTSLDRAMAVIEFLPDGTILDANNNFLETLGYKKSDVVGKHHRMFCTDEFLRENPTFWEALASGKYNTGKFERRKRNGDTVWLEATYNPIFSSDGTVEKVVKFASDITARVQHDLAIQEAAEIASSTSEETLTIAGNGAELLKKNVEISESIASEVEHATGLIQQLNSQSTEISSIVTTISNIADQTNLLALNAAIEAARAGEYGRGFAVVADEVRQLASRTNESTLVISDIVAANQKLTRDTTHSMEKVQAQTQTSSDLISQAAEVIEEIRMGAENVSRSVARLSAS